MHKYFEINEQGSNIRCKAYIREKGAASKAILYCTGFAGHRDNRAAERFAEKALSKYRDVAVVVFDWPAHGDDVRKKLQLADCDTYLGLVVKKLKEDPGISELYAYATSFGGYLVLKYISEHENPFQKIALRCPAVDMYDVLTRSIMKNDEYDRIAKGKDVQVGFDRERDYLEPAEDILILHGTADEVVPFAEGKAFAENQLIEFIPVEGADHRFQNPAHMSLANKYAMEFFGF